MLIREPLVHATYFYLRETPGSNPTRRQEWHDVFVDESQRILQSVSGWLALPAPALPVIPVWEAEPPVIPQPLMQTGELVGRTNASAWFTAYALRNMLLLRVVVSRPGEHEQAVWTMLDEASGIQSNAESWLHTTRYWCGMAPRSPEELSHAHSQPIKAPFGVLCLGWNSSPHLLVYPDAKTEARAVTFLKSLAAQLDWYPVQAHHLLGQYETRSFSATRNQQTALDQVAHSVQEWAVPVRRNRLRSLSPLQNELDTLERTYGDILTDRTSTEAAAHDVRALMSEYRLVLLQNGLWDSAPSAWEAQIAGLSVIQQRIEADVQHIDVMLRRTELLLQGLQTRVTLLQSERERLLIYLVMLLGLAVLTVLIADTDLALIVVRLLGLLLVAGIVWAAWQSWLGARSS